MKIVTTLALLTLLGGCADAPDQEPEPAAASIVATVLANETIAWPSLPNEEKYVSFDVPEEALGLEVRFNWRGQQPGGYSSSRQAVLLSPSGQETDLMTADLPLNPYLCASDRCGPAQDRVERFTEPEDGTWYVALRGAYTAMATVLAVAEAPGDAK